MKTHQSPSRKTILASALCLLASVVPLLAQSTLNDGIPDSWRVQYFGTNFMTNPQAVATADPDGDGANNLQEYQAGTDPTNASSKPTVPVSVSTYAGTGVAGGQDGYRTNATFVSPNAISLGPDGALYVPEGGTVNSVTAHRIRRVDVNGTVSTVAGTNYTGSADGQGAAASFNSPAAIVFDSLGNMFVAEGGGNRVRRIDAGGMVTTFAGSGVAGFRDDIGTNAQFNGLNGMAVDKSNNLYVGDFNNRRVRRINPQGQVTTFAGTGTSGSANGFRTNATFNGVSDVAMGPDGTMFVADWGNGSVRKIDTNGVVSTIKSGLTYMERLSVDSSGCVYASRRSNATTPLFYKLAPDGTVLWSFTNPQGFQDGSPAVARFSHYTTSVIYPDGNLVIPDVENNRLRYVSVAVPAALAISPAGGMFTNSVTVTMATTLTNVTLRYTVDGSVPVAGSPAYPGALLLTNTTHFQARAFFNTNPVSDVVSVGFTNTSLPLPTIDTQPVSQFVAAGSNATFTVSANSSAPLSYQWRFNGNNLTNANNTTLNLSGVTTNQVGSYTVVVSHGGGSVTSSPAILTVGFTLTANASAGGTLTRNPILSLYTNGSTVTLTAAADTGYSFSGWSGSASGTNNPLALVMNSNKAVTASFVAVPVYSLNDGIPDSWRVRYFGTNFLNDPQAVALADADGDGANNFQEYQVGTDPTNAGSKPSVPVSVSTYAGTGAAGGQDGYRTNATFLNPVGMAAGPGGEYYVLEGTADGGGNDTVGAHRIRKIDVNGMVTTLAGGDTPGSVDGPALSARFKYPEDMVFDSMGNTYVVEGHGHRIRKISAGGMVSMFVGSAAALAGNANGTGTNALFNTPWGIAIDPLDNLYVVDLGNNLVRKITSAGVVTTYASGFSTPSDIVRATDGTLWVSDWGSASIKRVYSGGAVDTFKTGLSYIERAVVDAAGNVYATLGNTGTSSRRFYKFDSGGAQQWVISTVYGYADGPIATAQFYHFTKPVILANGDILVAEDQTARVRLIQVGVPAALTISPAGGMFTNSVSVTLATTLTNVTVRYTVDGSVPVVGSPAYTGALLLTNTTLVQARAFFNTNPVSAVVSASFSNFNSYALNDGIPDSWRVRYFGTNFLNDPQAVALADADGDGANNLQEYQAGTDPTKASSRPTVPVSVSTFAGTGAAGGQDGYRTNATFNNPSIVVVGPDGAVYVSEETEDSSGNDIVGAQRIRRIDVNGMVTTFVGSDTPGSLDGPIATATLRNPTDFNFDSLGNMFITEEHMHRIRKVSAGGMVSVFAGSATGVSGYLDGLGTNALFNTPVSVVAGASNDLYVADFGNNVIRKVTVGGVVTTHAGGFSHPSDVVRGGDGALWISDWGNAAIKKIDTNGVVSTFKNGLSYIERLGVDAQGNVYAALGNVGSSPRSLYKFNAAGVQQWVISTAMGYQDGSIGEARFNHFCKPLVLADGNILHCDNMANRVRLIQMGVPAALTISPSGGMFTNSVSVTLATTLTNVTVRYTVDGSVPVAGSPAYTGALILTNTTLVQARAFFNTNPVSDIVSAAYSLVQPSCISAPAGLMAWWQGEGSVSDVSAGNLAAFQNGGGYATGKVGQSFSFNGANYVQLSSVSSLNFSGTNAMSLEMWAYRSGTNSIMSLIGKRSGSQIQYQVGFDPTDGLQFVAGYGGQSLRALLHTQMPVNAWMHMAVTYDGVTARFYTNGVLGVSADGSLGTALNVPLQIGTADGVSYPYANFVGQIDEVSFYNRALSASEVAAIYNAQAAGKCEPTPSLALTNQPQGQVVTVGGSVAFSVGVSGTGPITYQWRFNGTNVVGATNSVLTLGNVQPSDAGAYSVVVGNAAGMLTSSNAILTVTILGQSLFDDFDPGIDTPQWSAFGGTVLATNYGGVVSGNSSLWFGGTGSRFATTRVLNTSGGGTIGYYLRLAYGTSVNWETADLPGEGVVIEYSTDAGTQWTGIATNNSLSFTNWTQQQFSIPTGAQSTGTLFRWRQLANSGASYDHWALDDVSIQTFTNLVVPVILSGPASRNIIEGESASFTVTVSGTAPFSYQWQLNGTNLAGATGATLTLANVRLAQAGSYGVVVGNAAGSTTSSNAVLIVTAPVCASAPSGLVAWWTAEGSATDVAGGNNGQAFGSVNYTAGKAGQAFLFNGTSSYLQVPSSAALKFTGAFSVEAWVYYDRVPSNACAIAVKGPDGEVPLDWDFEIHSVRKLRANVNVNGSWVGLTCGTTLATNTWHHVAMVYDGSALRCYLNGVLDGFTSLSGSVQTSDNPVRIGAYAPVNANGSWNFFSGAIDELSIYNRALSADEVAAIYGARGAGKCGVTPALAITSQPQNQAVTLGSGAGFSVGVAGTPTIAYQWRFNGTNITGATNASLSLTNVQFAQAGDYSVVVGNSAGSMTSSNATLTVSAAVVRSGLVSLNNYEANNYSGAPIYLLNTSTLAPLDTRVQVLGGPLGGPLTPIISEATHTNVFPLSDGGDPGYFDAGYGYVGVLDDSPAMIQVLAWRGAASYAAATVRGSAIFTNMTGHGSSGTPPAPPMPAILQMPTIVMQSTATAAPAITVQPQGRTVIGGSSFTFGVVATGSPAVGYQWRFNGADIPGATNANFTIAIVQATHAGSYTVFVSNTAGSVLSDAATLTVRYLLSVTTGAGGTVAKNPASSNYALGTVVELTAAPDAGFAFTGWGGDATGTGNPLTVTVSTNKSITAGFAENVPPTVTITSPASGNASSSQTFLAGTASDNVGVVSARWLRDGQPVGSLALSNGTFRVDPLTLARGTNTFRVIAADAAGNEGSAQVTVVYAPPRVLAVVNPAARQEGLEVTVPIELTSPGDVAGMSFVLHYDAAYLKNPELKWSSAVASALATVNTSVDGEVRTVFTLSNSKTVDAGTTEIAQVTFQSRSVPTNLTTALTLEVSDMADALGNPIAAADVGNGVAAITVRTIKGDNNANNRLDTGDATIIQRMLAGLDPVRSWDVTGNDLNTSTTLDSGDVIKVMRAVVKLDSQPTPPASSGKSAATKALAAVVSPVELAVVSPNGLRGQSGELVTVQVLISNVRTQLAGAEFTLDYPTNALRLVNSSSHQPGSLVSGDTFALWNVLPAQTDYVAQTGRVIAGMSSGTGWPVATNGTLAQFTFQVQPGAAAQYRWPLVLSGVRLTTANGYSERPVSDAQMYFIGRNAIPANLGSAGGKPQLSGNGFNFGLGGEVGLPYLIEVSTNLSNWVPLQTVTNMTGTLPFNDPGATNSIQRYYRARQLE